ELGLKEKNYFILTLHRPSNVDDGNRLTLILKNIEEGVGDTNVIFPAHPRTRLMLNKSNWKGEKIKVLDPMSYLEFMFLIKHAGGVITDSGGIQEETTYLNVPCLTLRANTERPETISYGTNELIGDKFDLLKSSLKNVRDGNWKKGSVPPMWDGNAATKIVDSLLSME
ncbi:MAG: UDP-N-acetylglucosamine 2-epimerase, partial [Cyclobacteriaceae bacterium]|nr:UDP-N-acetylglucosamine 2-epimerase [Cyclobacteriaceae bacterium]